MPVNWKRGAYGVPEGYVPGGTPLWRRPGNVTGRVRPTPVPMPGYMSGGGPQLQMTPAWYRPTAPVVAGAGTQVASLQTAVPQRELQMTPAWYRPVTTMETPARSPGGFQGAGGVVRQVVGAVAPYGQAYTQAAREAAAAGMLGGGAAGGGAAGGGAGQRYAAAPRGVPAGWYRQFQEEHGETPEAFYGRQGETLDEAWADKEWGDEFYRQYGRAPSQSEWEENWYQTRRGHGRPVFSGAQWDVIRRMNRRRRGGGGGTEEVPPRVIVNPVRWRTWGG